MLPRVLVGAPVCDLYKYCFDEFLNNIKNFTYKNYDILLIDNSKDDKFYNEIKDKVRVIRLNKYYERMRERVTQVHNLLREITLKENYDYLLNLDQDIIPPQNVIERLLNHNKKLISGLYFGHHILDDGTNRIMPFAWVFKDNSERWGNLRYLNENEIWQQRLIKIAFAGAGCILIHKSVLEKIKFRYSLKIDAWDDRWLGYDVAKHNFEFYLDNTIKCKHLYLNRPFDYQKDIKAKGKN